MVSHSRTLVRDRTHNRAFRELGVSLHRRDRFARTMVKSDRNEDVQFDAAATLVRRRQGVLCSFAGNRCTIFGGIAYWQYRAPTGTPSANFYLEHVLR